MSENSVMPDAAPHTAGAIFPALRLRRLRRTPALPSHAVQRQLSQSLSQNRQRLAHFAESSSSQQNVPVPFSSRGFAIGSQTAVERTISRERKIPQSETSWDREFQIS